MPRFNEKPASMRLNALLITLSLTLLGCGGGSSSQTSSSSSSSNNSTSDNQDSSQTTETSDSENGDTTENISTEVVDLRNAILEELSADCADYVNEYEASVSDISRSLGFSEDVVITASETSCTFSSNNIPNHDFNDDTAHFATNVAEVNQNFSLPRSPSLANATTAISQGTYNGIMLNGIPIDILSAGCYSPNSAGADNDGNVAIGCTDNASWLLDPLGTESKFGADQHNAHTQPNGSYHYHGSPNALFDDNPGPDGSPVIGFAADGFPIYGSYFLDTNSGTVRKAVSGYTLKSGSRPGPDNNDPGGSYDGTYVQDWEFTNAGDLDACNGMTVDGQYGYYVTDTYPWLIKCFSGTPDNSFNKNAGQGPI